MEFPKEGNAVIEDKVIRRMYELVKEHEQVRNHILNYYQENYATDDNGWKILKKCSLLELVEKYVEERVNTVRETYEFYSDRDGYNEPNGSSLD